MANKDGKRNLLPEKARFRCATCWPWIIGAQHNALNFAQDNKSYEELKKELGGQTDLFDSVLASAVPARAVAAAAVANNVNGGIPDIKNFYTYDELRVVNEDLPSDVDPGMKEVGEIYSLTSK